MQANPAYHDQVTFIITADHGRGSGLALRMVSMNFSSGAGSGGQNAIGTGVIGGMLSATVLAIFFVPVFFVAVRKVFSGGASHADSASPQSGGREAELST